MAFNLNDLQELKQLLRAHPEWRAELREIILTDELVALPRQFAEAQARSDARFERIELALEQLAQAQARTEARVEELAQAQARTEARVEELAQAQVRTEARLTKVEAALEQLAQAQARTEARLAELIQQQKIFGERQDKMLGEMMELRFSKFAPSYFGRVMRRVRIVLPDKLDAATEDLMFEHLTEVEHKDVMRLDGLARGRLVHPPSPEISEVWLAAEVSSRIDRNDVERALRRAKLLRKMGLAAIPVVIGDQLTTGATQMLNDEPVLVLLDEHDMNWERALKDLEKRS